MNRGRSGEKERERERGRERETDDGNTTSIPKIPAEKVAGSVVKGSRLNARVARPAVGEDTLDDRAMLF